MKKRVAVLALQGAFLEHERVMKQLGADCFELRQKADLERPFDALILPGGESTVQTKLLVDLEMLEPLKSRIAGGMPTLGTCAGLILLAKRIEEPNDRTGVRTVHEGALGTLEVTVERNAFGRQLGSAHEQGSWFDGSPIPLTLIRAPRIVALNVRAEPLATFGGQPVGVRQGNQIGLTYHPELDDSALAHELLLSL